MDDTCIIARDPGGTKDDALDPVTGKLVTNAALVVYPTEAMAIADPQVITDGGPCSLRPVGEGFTTTQTRVQGGDAQTYRTYNLKLPINKAPDILEGDFVTVLSSRRDPLLPGVKFRVREIAHSTFSISRRVLVERLTVS